MLRNDKSIGLENTLCKYNFGIQKKNFKSRLAQNRDYDISHTLHKSPDVRINVDLPIPAEEGNALWARFVVNNNTVTMPRKRVGTYIILLYALK